MTTDPTPPTDPMPPPNATPPTDSTPPTDLPALHGGVFIPTDGSAFANAALPVAADLARRLGTTVTVAYVVTDPEGGLPLGLAPYALDYDRARAAARRVGQRFLDDAATRLAPDTKRLLLDARGRSVARCLADAAREDGAGVIVVSTHGRSGLPRLLLGSVAQGLAHHASVPVLFIRPPGTGAP